MQAREPLPHHQSKSEKNMKRSVNHVDCVVAIQQLKLMGQSLEMLALSLLKFKKSLIAGGMATKKHSQKQDIGCE